MNNHTSSDQTPSNLVNLVVYPKKTGLEFSKVVSGLFQSSQFDVCEHDFSQPLNLAHPTMLVFPILGDNQLPVEVEKWIRSSRFAPSLDCFFAITGDFDESPEGQFVVMNETIQLISHQGGQVSYIPLMIDTPVQQSEDIQREIWVSKVISICSTPNSFSFTPQTDNSASPRSLERHEILERDEWKKLVRLLKAAPLVSFASQDNNEELKLILTDRKAYPRTLLSDLDEEDLQKTFELIDQLPSITSLDLSFANLAEWPAITPHLYETLTALNIRGNCFRSYEFIGRFHKLEKLNIAANHLSHVPEAIFNLPQLKVLYAYKNSIKDLDANIGKLKNLKRLTLYRNLLEGLPATLGFCQNLEVLNIGGNPILNLPDEISKLSHLKKVILRNCGLKYIPPVLLKLTLEEFDISKNLLNESEAT